MISKGGGRINLPITENMSKYRDDWLLTNFTL